MIDIAWLCELLGNWFVALSMIGIFTGMVVLLLFFFVVIIGTLLSP